MDQALIDALAAAGAAIDAGDDYTPHITQDQINKMIIVLARNRFIGDPKTP